MQQKVRQRHHKSGYWHELQYIFKTFIHTQSRTFLVEQLSTPITAYHCLLGFDKDLSESDELYLDFDEDLLEPDDPDKGLSDAGTDEDFY